MRAEPDGGASTRIVLVAGRVRSDDRVGHHDYLAGCRLLADLLARTPGVDTRVVRDGWPDDEAVLDGAASIAFYDGGGGKQGFLASPARIARVERAVDAGVGLVMIHQAVGSPVPHAERAQRWLGGAYVPGLSRRGHWQTRHLHFPVHPVTRGVTSWTIRDGWLTRIQFVEGMRGVTPLVWSGRRHAGASEGGAEDVAAWVYERPDGGRSFGFTGLDAHAAWTAAGLRQLLVNAVLWSARVALPADGAPSELGDAEIAGYLTPRAPRGPLRSVAGQLRRALGRRW